MYVYMKPEKNKIKIKTLKNEKKFSKDALVFITIFFLVSMSINLKIE